MRKQKSMEINFKVLKAIIMQNNMCFGQSAWRKNLHHTGKCSDTSNNANVEKM